MRYCLYTNSNMKGKPTHLCEVTKIKVVNGRDFIVYKPLDETAFSWGQEFLDSEDIRLVDPEIEPELFL